MRAPSLAGASPLCQSRVDGLLQRYFLRMRLCRPPPSQHHELTVQRWAHTRNVGGELTGTSLPHTLLTHPYAALNPARRGGVCALKFLTLAASEGCRRRAPRYRHGAVPCSLSRDTPRSHIAGGATLLWRIPPANEARVSTPAGGVRSLYDICMRVARRLPRWLGSIAWVKGGRACVQTLRSALCGLRAAAHPTAAM